MNAAVSRGVSGPLVVVMGVAGSGKSTVAQLAAERLGADFLEGDCVHPPSNVAKMRAGVPLTDEDRWPWLAICRDWLAARGSRPGVLTCSALRRRYRDVLRGAGDVRFVYLSVAEAELVRRMRERTGHFMPASLLASQLATLEPLDADEMGFDVDGTLTPEDVAQRLADRLTR